MEEIFNDFGDLDNSIALNPRLMPTKGKELALKVDKLASFIKEQQLYVQSKRNPEYDDAALTNILTNLLVARDKGKILAYPRNKNAYVKNSKIYGFEYFSYRRYIKIINALCEQGYFESKIGFFDKEKGRGKNSRLILILPSFKLDSILSHPAIPIEMMYFDYYYVNKIGEIRYVVNNNLVQVTKHLPKIAVILKDSTKQKKPIAYTPTSRTIIMLKHLDKYNDFISKVNVVLPEKYSELRPYTPKVEITDLSKFDQVYPFPSKVSSEDEAFRTFISFLAFSSDPVNKYIAPLNNKAKLQVVAAAESNSRVMISQVRPAKKTRGSDALLKNGSPGLRSEAISNLSEGIPNTNGTVGIGEEAPSDISAAQASAGDLTNTNNEIIAECSVIKCELYRIFNNNSFTQGGRFYGADYQLIDGKSRRKMLIQGEPVVEVDYSSYHPRMLYHLSHIDYQENPYDLFNKDADMIKAVKSLLNIAINSKTRKAAVSAFVKKQYIKVKPDNIKAAKIKQALANRGLTPATLYDKIINSHKFIANYVGKNYGVRLQFIDSQIADSILMHFTKKGIACLCVHDSFIVQKRYEAELVQVMKDVYRKVMKFECQLDVKRDS